jgi:RNA polymerase sigma-70 factor, ECF subfamily
MYQSCVFQPKCPEPVSCAAVSLRSTRLIRSRLPQSFGASVRGGNARAARGAVLHLRSGSKGSDDVGAPPRRLESEAEVFPDEKHEKLEEERVLVDRVQRGDVAAFDALVRRYIQRATVVARRLTGNRHDTEDLVQDAFLRALDRISTFDNSRPFGPWFFRVLTNQGLNSRRAQIRRATEPEPMDAPSHDAGPDVILERREVQERFAAALARLPERQRLIVGWFEVDEVPTAEIASTLGITQETVRWHLHQARRTLRAALAPIKD